MSNFDFISIIDKEFQLHKEIAAETNRNFSLHAALSAITANRNLWCRKVSLLHTWLYAQQPYEHNKNSFADKITAGDTNNNSAGAEAL
jgi:hypothetical protein